MTKMSAAVKYAHDSGYRVTDDGRALSPRLKERKLYKLGSHAPLYYAFGVAYCGSIVMVPVHRLSAYQKYGNEIFCNGVHVRHLDGNSLNNNVDNLAIGNASDNMMDIPRETRVANAKHASSFNARTDWKEIDYDREAGMSYRQLCRKHGVSKSTLSYRYGISSQAREKKIA